MKILLAMATALLFVSCNMLTDSAEKKYKSNVKDQMVSLTKIKLLEVAKSTEVYFADCGKYPKTLNDLTTKPDDCSNWGPTAYMSADRAFQDAWGSDIRYTNMGDSYQLISLGADKATGGTDSNSDIIHKGGYK